MKEIFERRSVRKYREETIPEEQLSLLLKAAMRAPSAGDERPWEFVVLRDRARMVDVLEFHPFAFALKEADCAVVVCGNTKLQKFPYEYWIQDCSAATENLLLEAVHLGIGAVWMALYPVEERVAGMKELLKLPEEVIPLNIICLGYPSEEAKPADTFQPERIHRESWGKHE